jgi:hypothetical protein
MGIQGERIDLTGQRFGRLVVVSYAETRRSRAFWLCKCDCGGEKVIAGKYLRKGLTQSCGCIKRERIAKVNASHGMSKTETYGIYRSMISRCYNKNQKAYAKYGALGVTVCDHWRKSFENFLTDMGERPEGMSLDRKNPFGNYEPDNCKWSDDKEQSINRRGHVAIEILEYLRGIGYGEIIQNAFQVRYAEVAS